MESDSRRSVLIIYTGGTIGMVQEPDTGLFRPFDFAHLYAHVPEIRNFDIRIDSISFENPIDSSNMNPAVWKRIAEIIASKYHSYDGFVILHGSDTMAYTASALSFMLQNLAKPVILTGSQLPIGMIRTDGKENLITAIEIAADYDGNKPIVPEVAVYFEYQLYRGNRTHKYNAEHFEAFESPNYPVLAEAGVRIKYSRQHIAVPATRELEITTRFDERIGVLHLFPGIHENFIQSVFHAPGIRAIIIVSFGAGNAPGIQALETAIADAANRGIIIYNVTQCNQGTVEPERYGTNSALMKYGISGGDITLEAAITKLMFVLGKNLDLEETKTLLRTSLAGEIS